MKKSKRTFGKILMTLMIIFFYLPILYMIIFSFNSGKSLTAFTGFSLRWYQHMMESGDMMEALYTTFSVALLATAVSTVVGTKMCIRDRIYSLDGQQLLYDNVMEDVKAQMTLPIEAGTLTEERMLVVELEVESEEVYYYTRIKDPSECNLTSCMDYIYNFHENALSNAENYGISDAIEPSGEGDNTTFQHVTIHSDYDHVTWGDLEPKVSGEERWYVMETKMCIRDRDIRVQEY